VLIRFGIVSEPSPQVAQKAISLAFWQLENSAPLRQVAEQGPGAEGLDGNITVEVLIVVAVDLSLPPAQFFSTMP
jgi:hypothetical protein